MHNRICWSNRLLVCIVPMSVLVLFLCGSALAQKAPKAEVKKTEAKSDATTSSEEVATTKRSTKNASSAEEPVAESSDRKVSTGKTAKSAKAKTAGDQSESEDASPTPRRRLPRFFGRLNLKDDQRDKIYDIQASYEKQIQDLQEQLNRLRDKMDSEIDDVLTAGQKRMLATLRKPAAAPDES